MQLFLLKMKKKVAKLYNFFTSQESEREKMKKKVTSNAIVKKAVCCGYSIHQVVLPSGET